MHITYYILCDQARRCGCYARHVCERLQLTNPTISLPATPISSRTWVMSCAVPPLVGCGGF
jgi:hypothetical protein